MDQRAASHDHTYEMSVKLCGRVWVIGVTALEDGGQYKSVGKQRVVLEQ